MVRKEDLCDWFKALPAHKRVDYMCGLLHMCHPLELRFTGTVLEDLAKKDFNYLRDQEIKANQRADLSSNNSNSLNDQKLRAKIITALALMNSTNLPCSEIIFDILQQQFDRFDNDSLQAFLLNKVNAADLIMILTMAVHHPAFTFYQKDRLGQYLEKVAGRMRELYGDEDEDERDLILQSQTLTPETIIQPNSLNSSQSPITQPEKASVVAIEVISAEQSQNKKGGTEYRIRTTWSNGEVTEVLLKFKQLQELHHKMLHRFPEQKKTHSSVPVFPGQATHNGESLSDQINSLNTYFSKLAKAPAHILDCDILTEPLRSGTLVYQPKPASIIHTIPSASIPQSHTQAVFIQTSPMPEDRKYEFSPYRQAIMMPYPNLVSHSHCSPGTSQMSSAANSPANSRTSSPAPLASHAGGKSNYLPLGNVKVSNAAISGIGILQPVRNSDQISQLLHVLNLEEYYDNLKDYSFQQIMHMSKEELAKAGLPADAQAKLKSKLDQIKPADYNGMVDPSRFSSADTSPAFYPPFWFPPFPFTAPPYQQHFIHPSAYAAHSGHITLLPSPHSHIPASENSPANSEASSPPPSPLQPMASLTLDHNQGHIVNQVQPGQPHHMMSPPPAAVAADSDGKLLKSAKTQPFDSSGSEEERAGGYGQELGILRGKGRGRPQQSRSLPLINQGTQPVSAMEAKVTGMPISMSAPHTHPAHISAEPRNGNTPPLQAVSAVAAQHISANPAATGINGYISDPPPVPPHGASSVVPRPILNFKTPQPAHTSIGIHKNVMNMPTPDISHQLSNLGKNSANTSSMPMLHGSLPPQSYTIGPSIASVPPTHVMGLSPVNFPANSTLQLGPQPSPTQSLMPEGNSAFPLLMYTHPRGILTTFANSTAIMTTTQSHHSGPPMSHSPSPAATVMCTDQLPAAQFITEALDPTRSEGSCLTPPVQTPIHINAVKSQTNAGGTNSGTPSPPLIPVTPKQVGTNETQPGVRGHQMYSFLNGIIPPIIYSQQAHHPPQHFPNGISSDYNWVRVPHIPSNHFPIAYGSVFPHQNLPGTLHVAPSSSGPPASTNQSHAGGGGSGKSRCYNCGLAGHKATECNEIRMENMTNTYHLSYKPSEPPA